MKTLTEALEHALGGFTRLERERVALDQALGRVTAEEILARADCPAFDNSAMDGYALRASDVTEPNGRLPVCGESRAGGPAPDRLKAGTAMRIFTGAIVPEGADTVVLQEEVQLRDDRVCLPHALAAGRHIRRRGGDLKAGSTALAQGHILGPGEIGLLASQEYARVDVVRRPRVAILSSGDELRDIGAPARPGSVLNSNAYALSAQVRRAGGEPWTLPPVPDELGAATRCVAEALSADVVLCSGGVSVGEYDVMRQAFSAAGVELGFWKVAMKPGKPLSFGMHGRTPVVGLPGNPVSAFVSFELFVRPGLRIMQGDARPHLPTVQVRLERPHRHRTGRLELARARLRQGPDGWIASLSERQGSGALSGLVDLDGLVVLAADQESFSDKAPLTALWLQGPGSAEPARLE